MDSHDWDHHPDLYTHHGWPNHHDFGHHGFGHHWNDHHFGLYFGWGIPYWPYYSTWYAPTWGSGSTTYIVQTDEVLPTSSSEVPPVYEEEPVPLEVDATVPTPEPNAALQAPVEGIVPIAPLVETREAPESLPEETPPAPAPSRPESP